MRPFDTPPPADGRKFSLVARVSAAQSRLDSEGGSVSSCREASNVPDVVGHILVRRPVKSVPRLLVCCLKGNGNISWAGAPKCWTEGLGFGAWWSVIPSYQVNAIHVNKFRRGERKEVSLGLPSLSLTKIVDSSLEFALLQILHQWPQPVVNVLRSSCRPKVQS